MAIEGTDGPDVLIGTAGDDTIKAGAGNDNVVAGDGNDRVVAGAGKDVVEAGAGNDSANGGGGDDILDGGEGDDRLFGGAGDDIIIGGNGNDVLYGGKPEDKLDTHNNGADQFWFDDDDGSDKVFGFTTSDVKESLGGTADRADTVQLTDGGTYTLEYKNGSTILTYGATSVTFYNAILESDYVFGSVHVV